MISYVYISYSFYEVMNKKGSWVLGLSMAFAVVLVIGLFFYFALIGPNNENYYIDQEASGSLKNPASGLSVEEAKEAFNESFVYYLLYEIGAYNLHNPPLSSDAPKMEIIVEEQKYNAVIDEGMIIVQKGEIEEEDIVIVTTREEAVKMLNSKEYVRVSFEDGFSYIELRASKSLLFSKGYLSLYTDLTGKSVTGGVIRIYTE